jgi:carbamoyltransferase
MAFMNILGINTNAACSVCLVSDGKPILAVQEERFSRIKNHGGFPELCLQYLCEHYSDYMKDLDIIAFSDEKENCEFVTHSDLANQYHHRFENWDMLPDEYNPTLTQRIKIRFNRSLCQKNSRKFRK